MSVQHGLSLLLILSILAALWQWWGIMRPGPFHRWLGLLIALALATGVTGPVLMLADIRNEVLYNVFRLWNS